MPCRRCFFVTAADCGQSLFFFRFNAGECKRAQASSGSPTRKKHLQCLSRLAPSVTRVNICVSRALRWTDQEKKRLLVVYYCRAKLELLSDTETLATLRLIHSPKLSKSTSSTFLRSFPRLHLTCIDREGLGRHHTGTRHGASHSQSSFRSSSRLYIVFLMPYKVMPFCDISETRDGRPGNALRR